MELALGGLKISVAIHSFQAYLLRRNECKCTKYHNVFSESEKISVRLIFKIWRFPSSCNGAGTAADSTSTSRFSTHLKF